ncbi:hypothetical protein [Hazenella coriacea]|uniref:Uncharacterized protein n=1 Tax=Hazenella coriacea TaxID=1179467 RepID=A0A4R3LAS2_9BACL|nr:hypothetical protein [Hazenella coriacea]TCS96963.1 hypothetical protein EDD58_101610 [Hazenella coriacea]
MRDPKQILDSFRTDVSSRNMYTDLLRQFDLEEPNHGKPNRKKSSLSRSPMKGTAAVLSLCLVTGLTAGIGTASAESEIAPDHAPIDQPVQKPKVEVEQPKHDIQRGETPPSDQSPREDFSNKPKEVEKPKVEKAQVKENSEPIPTEKPKETTQSTHSPSSSTPMESDHSKSPQAVEQTPNHVTPPNEASSNASQGQTKANIQYQPNKEQKEQVGNHSSQLTEKASGIHKSEPSKNVSSQDSLLVAESNKQAKPEENKKEQPKTVEGGELPKTAGNDLNGVLMGSGMALLGSIYAFRRGKAKRS